jgi:exosortase
MKKFIISYKSLLIYSLLVLAFIACYYYTFGWLHYKFSYKESYYSHGYLIPIISAFLVYLKWDQLKNIKSTSMPIGLVIFVFALLLHIVAKMGDVNFLSGFSMFFYLIGASLYIMGKQITRAIIFPICFLLFMFPIPDNFINTIALPSKSLATSIGTLIVDLINIPYLREGFRIELPQTSLVVGTPCNGMNSLISFMALGMLFIYFSALNMWKITAILVSIYPLAILLNGIRIATLIYIAYNFGVEKASPESPLHTLSGMAVFIVGLLVLIIFIKISEKKD